MGRAISPVDRRFRELLGELSVLRTDGPPVIAEWLPRLRAVVKVESLVCFSPVQSTSGWALERFHSANLPNTSRFRTLVTSHLLRTNFAGVERNKLAPLGDDSALHADVLKPLSLHRHHLVCALLCEGDTLIGWFGAFHSTPLDAGQLALLDEMLPALRQRIALERQLESAPLVSAALEAVLEQIAGPAFVVSSTGRIFDVNEAGRTMLESRRGELSDAVAAALAGASPKLPIELIPLSGRDAHDHWLAVLRTRGADSRANHAIARAAARLNLTRRQRDVLTRLVLGESNATIAARLKITERAVEQHVTALFDRAAVDNRSALVTYVLLG